MLYLNSKMAKTSNTNDSDAITRLDVKIREGSVNSGTGAHQRSGVSTLHVVRDRIQEPFLPDGMRGKRSLVMICSPIHLPISAVNVFTFETVIAMATGIVIETPSCWSYQPRCNSAKYRMLADTIATAAKSVTCKEKRDGMYLLNLVTALPTLCTSTESVSCYTDSQLYRE